MRLRNNPEQKTNPNKKKNWVIVILRNVGIFIITVVGIVLTAIGLSGDSRRK